MTFTLVLWHEQVPEINQLPEKTRRILTISLENLKEYSFPGSLGDKEKFVLKGGVPSIACIFPVVKQSFMILIRKKASNCP